uniref:Uncharacterized protein n=1 Tax=Cucumis melo TaxID=3656 RepID=A0A9I9E753_CUCME
MLRKLEFQVSEEDHTKELRAFTLACDIALWHCTVARRVKVGEVVVFGWGFRLASVYSEKEFQVPPDLNGSSSSGPSPAHKTLDSVHMRISFLSEEPSDPPLGEVAFYPAMFTYGLPISLKFSLCFAAGITRVLPLRHPFSPLGFSLPPPISLEISLCFAAVTHLLYLSRSPSVVFSSSQHVSFIRFVETMCKSGREYVYEKTLLQSIDPNIKSLTSLISWFF